MSFPCQMSPSEVSNEPMGLCEGDEPILSGGDTKFLSAQNRSSNIPNSDGRLVITPCGSGGSIHKRVGVTIDTSNHGQSGSATPKRPRFTVGPDPTGLTEDTDQFNSDVREHATDNTTPNRDRKQYVPEKPIRCTRITGPSTVYGVSNLATNSRDASGTVSETPADDTGVKSALGRFNATRFRNVNFILYS